MTASNPSYMIVHFDTLDRRQTLTASRSVNRQPRCPDGSSRLPLRTHQRSSPTSDQTAGRSLDHDRTRVDGVAETDHGRTTSVASPSTDGLKGAGYEEPAAAVYDSVRRRRFDLTATHPLARPPALVRTAREERGIRRVDMASDRVAHAFSTPPPPSPPFTVAHPTLRGPVKHFAAT